MERFHNTKKYHQRWRLYTAYMIDTVDIVYTVFTVYTIQTSNYYYGETPIVQSNCPTVAFFSF